MTKSKLKSCVIISEGVEDCDKLMKMISRDEKTTYDDPAFTIDQYTVSHHVLTQHNSLNLKRKYNTYQIKS